MTPNHTAVLLGVLAEAYPALDVTETRVDVWAALLADQDREAMMRAAVAYVRSGERFPPNPGQLIQLARPSDGPTPEVAWGEVRSAIGEVGYTGVPAWSHPRVARAARAALGEWANYCKTATPEQMVSDRARFLDAYRGIEDRDASQDEYARASALLDGTGAPAGLLGSIGLLDAGGAP